MPLDPKIKQLVCKVETTEATAVDHTTLFASANAAFLVKNLAIDWDPDFQQRGLDRTTKTRAPGYAGLKSARVKFDLETVAGGTSNKAQIHDLLRACGMRSSQLAKVVWDGDLGTTLVIPHGTIVTQGANTFMVFGEWHLPETPGTGLGIFYCGRQEAAGTGSTALNAAADIVLTTPSGGAVGTIALADIESVTSAAGYGYHPMSKATSRITFDATGSTSTVTAGDTIYGVTSGARARVHKTQAAVANADVYIERLSGYFSAGETIGNATTVDADIGILAASNFEIQQAVPTVSIGGNFDGNAGSVWGARGTFKFTAEGGRITNFSFDMLGGFNASDGRAIVSPTLLQRTPPVFLSADFGFGPYNADITHAEQLASALWKPCIAKIEVDIGNTVELVDCANSSVGNLGARITGERNATMTVDPEATSEAHFAMVNRMMTGGLVRAGWGVGTTAPDFFQFFVPAAQLKSLPYGERKGALTQNAQFDLTSGSDSSPFGDNEFVIVHRVL